MRASALFLFAVMAGACSSTTTNQSGSSTGGSVGTGGTGAGGEAGASSSDAGGADGSAACPYAALSCAAQVPTWCPTENGKCNDDCQCALRCVRKCLTDGKSLLVCVNSCAATHPNSGEGEVKALAECIQKQQSACLF